ncbi:hypothetical protein PR048_011156 [Dryococelus australis]|uniref:Uncharacterized protein n=1 Tax=Dryococelus australis TaxID=614101 RepID=A0ABQ9HKZ8_9NEOP|nr:hypothetical protein PR048_011156 [Dryococelus australis]
MVWVVGTNSTDGQKIVKKNVRKNILGYEEFSTILWEEEFVINSRPPTYLSEDTEDLAPFTPAMFLQDNLPIGVPDIDHLENASLSKRARFLQ